MNDTTMRLISRVDDCKTCVQAAVVFRDALDLRTDVEWPALNAAIRDQLGGGWKKLERTRKLGWKLYRETQKAKGGEK